MTPTTDMTEIIAKSQPTKVVTDGAINVLWENNDAIGLRYQQSEETIPVMCSYKTILPIPSSTAIFKMDADVTDIPNKVDGKYVAVYPATPHYISWSKKSNVVFAVNPDQIARNKGFDPSSMIMIATSDDSDFLFQHVVSYIKFTVTTESSSFNRITVKSLDESQYMVSRIRVDFDDDFSYKLESLNSSGAINTQTRDFVTLTTSDNSNFAPGTYYIAINPAVYARGLQFTFENEGGYSATMSYTGSLDAKPGYVMNIGTVGNLEYRVTLPYISLFNEKGKDLGVVFYEDPDDNTKKKVVSAASGVMKWATSNNTWGISNYKKNYDYVHTIITTSDAYKANPDDFPAVRFCDEMRKSHGGNWHLPSVDEMNILFNAYYGKPYDTEVTGGLQYSDEKSLIASAYFDALLESIGCDTMMSKSDKYWLCGQNNSGNMQYVKMSSYSHGHTSQTTENFVRCICDIDGDSPNDSEYPITDIGKLLQGGVCPRITDVLYDDTYSVTDGLDYYEMTVNTDSDERQKMYLLRVDPSQGLDLKVAISDETTSAEWYRQELSIMAENMSTISHPVYGMINADFCDNTIPINPRGPVHCDGQIWSSVFDLDPSLTHQGLSYVGVTYDGKMTIDSSDNYESAKASLKECTGAGVILVKDSQIQGGLVTTQSRDPRTAIGYTSNNIVWMLVVDGRHGTLGMTYSEMAYIFKGLGCVAAVNLDGGGSSEMLVRNPWTELIEICNWPSDPTNGAGGEERPRLNAWAVVKK